MSKRRFRIAASRDGYVAGPDQGDRVRAHRGAR
jgi:hypothetical protein